MGYNKTTYNKLISLEVPHSIALALASTESPLIQSGVDSTGFDLAGGASAATIVTAHNALVTALRSGGLLVAAPAAPATPLAPPTITSFTPVTGPAAGGTAVTLTGTHLDTVTAVTFGGTAGTSLTHSGATGLTITTPAKSTGAVYVAATNPDGSVTAVQVFNYV